MKILKINGYESTTKRRKFYLLYIYIYYGITSFSLLVQSVKKTICYFCIAGIKERVNSNIMVYSSPLLIRPSYMPRNRGHVREVAFGERER